MYEQPSFLHQKQKIDTFWDDEDVRPFRLSLPDHFNRPNPQKQKNEIKYNKSPRAPSEYIRPNSAHRSHQKQRIRHPFTSRQGESYIYDHPYSTLCGYFAQKVHTNWIEKELNFSMSKLSFLVLIVGLFFLSSLLFITGFLVAVNIYDIGSPKHSQMPLINLPTFENAHLPTVPTIAMPNAASVAQQGAMPPATPNQNIMKSGVQGTYMADMPIVDTAHRPSVYAQLPTQTLQPVPQPMPQIGMHYIPSQQAPVVQHAPSQGYSQQQPHPTQQAPVQAPVQIQQPQNYPQPANQPYMQAQQQYYPQQQNPAPYPGPYYQPQYQPGTHQ
ncbi:MAG: hypothetical protein V4482_03210 [Pseudomonadota bacterium]